MGTRDVVNGSRHIVFGAVYKCGMLGPLVLRFLQEYILSHLVKVHWAFGG